MHWKKVEQTILEESPESVRGNCYFCGKDVDGMNYCFGCKEFVCDEFDKEEAPFGRHNVSEHRSKNQAYD